LLVSHDRTFLDNVVTSTLVFEGDGRFNEYAGGYKDWKRYQGQIPENANFLQERVRRVADAPRQNAEPVIFSGLRRKLTYKEQRELDALPGRIEGLENEQVELHRRMGDGDFYRQSSESITAAMERLEAIKRELELCYERWQALESLGGSVD
jgi:ATP-binding cassette subfamily F protein uup